MKLKSDDDLNKEEIETVWYIIANYNLNNF